jgi:hypothetical protein
MSVVRQQSAIEYFKELVDDAIAHQGLAAKELTAFYVVHLLASFLQRPAGDASEDDAPLAVRLGRALERGGFEQRTNLKQIGDQSLFVSGFFSTPSIANSWTWTTTRASVATPTRP